MTAEASFEAHLPLWVGDYVLHPGVGEGARVERATETACSNLPSLSMDGLAVARGDPALLAPIQAAVDAGQWPDVLRLGRKLEPQLIEAGHWGAWGQVLEWIRLAARNLDDQRVEAWSLHQLGIRALCLADDASARTHLANAFRLRQRIGDQAGEMATCDVLDLFLGPPQVEQPISRVEVPATMPVARAPDAPARPRARRSPVWAIAGAVLAVAAISLCGLATLQRCRATPVPSETPTWVSFKTSTPLAVTQTPVLPALVTPTPVTPTPTSVIALTATFTPVPTKTSTPTPTPSPTATPDKIGPLAPTLSQPAVDALLVCAADQPTHKVRFQWGAVQDPAGIKQYELYLAEIAPGTQVLPTRTYTSTQPVDVSLGCNKTFRWRVRAVDGANNNGDWSAERKVVVADQTVPPTPALASPPEGEAVECPADAPVPVLLKWNAVSDPSGIARYEVEVKREVTPPVVQVVPAPGIQISTTVSLTCNARYTWRVRALDGVGNVGTWSAGRALQVKPPPPDLVVADTLYPADTRYPSALQTTGQPAIGADGRVAVPIQFTIRNQGGTAAGAFRVALIYTMDGSGPFALAFSGPDMTDAPLDPASEVTFVGEALFLPAEQGKAIAMQVLADSCLGEAEFGADCRVRESNEGNNGSPPLLLTLPMVVTTTLRPVADASVDSRMPERPYGASDLLLIGTGLDAQNRPIEAEVLLSFDLGSIPFGAEIRRATLNMQVDPRWSVTDTPFALEIVRVDAQWKEHAVNWATRPALVQVDTSYPPIQSVITLSIGAESAQWEISPWVQDWVDGQVHWGVALRGRSEIGGRRAFFSRESEQSPRLVIEYVFVPKQETSQGKQEPPSGRP